MKTFFRIVSCCLLLLLTIACAAGVEPESRSSTVAAENTSTSTTVPTPTIAPTQTSAPTPTIEAPPTPEAEDAEVDETEVDEAESSEAKSDEVTSVAIHITMSLPAGDPLNGAELVEAKSCAGCHYLGRVGPAPSWKAEIYAKGKGIATRAGERWQLAGYTGEATNATEYLVESILTPNAFVIDGYMGGAMPQTFRELLTDQELADIISYLLEIE